MKKFLLLLFLFSIFTYSQVTNSQTNNFSDYEQGQLIVKLKDDVDTKTTYSKSGKASSNFNIGSLLGIEDKITSTEVMFHKKSIEQSIKNKQKMKAFYAAKAAANANNGYKPQVPITMKNVFVLKTENINENILSLIDKIKENPNVEYVEPNYLFGLDNFEVGEMITAEEASKLPASTVIDVDDPLYSVQNNIISTNLDDVWDQYSTGDGTQVVAILDTGVDYNHPDLAANTWINLAEQNGVAGFDDDGNGYIDDIQGWDFINVDNAPLDDNIHGTHVAGIVGAVGNNGIGIAGAAWNVKLMPIKVLQSTGSGNAATIAAGIEYAANNGATIINMSLGGSADSSVMRSALENAYATSVLVGSAGNSKKCIGPGLCPDKTKSSPSYPGAYSFVLGVQDAASYSNYDQDGPIATSYTNLLNYETYAPGSQIMSTAPNGGYVKLTGTSMAGPLVAGGLALYLKEKPDVSTELLFGDLINTSSTYVDFLAAIEVVAVPELAVLSVIERDNINGQNGNGIIQAGETVELLPLIRNFWGPTDDVRVGIAFAEFEDDSKATIIEDEIEIGSISAYATLQDLNESLKIEIAPNVANNVQIKFVVTAWSGPNKDHLSSELEVVINVKNSILLSGLISSDMTLSPEKEYLVASNVAVTGDAVVTILPGTILKFSDNVSMTFMENSKLICEGTKESRIKIVAENTGHKGITLNSVNTVAWHTIKFTEFSGIVNASFMGGSGGVLIEDCIVKDNMVGSSLNTNYNIMRRVNFINNSISSYAFSTYVMYYYRNTGSSLDNFKTEMGDYYSDLPKSTEGTGNYIANSYDINYINNTSKYDFQRNSHLYQQQNFTSVKRIFDQFNAFSNSHPIDSDATLTGLTSGSPKTAFPKLYLGSALEVIYDASSWNYLNENGVGTYVSQMITDWSEVATVPFEGAHGIVWKVLVGPDENNLKDAQDEYALMDPVGVGDHVFKVYFNRAMDTSVDPQISYGVRDPYNQNIITESGTWDDDGETYTVTHTVAVGAADGINRIRVQNARDLDLFEIPVEKSRFNILLQSAGSLSTNFVATAGLGNIALKWVAPNASNLNDVLGYNMYRYITNADGTFSDPVKLNQTVIIEDPDTSDVSFTDYEVVEEQSYFYKYKIVRTNFDETDYSSVVSSTPLTSELGDSNGDSFVNVMDLVQNVDYILGNNPSPFITKAADVNNDNTINVLDIAGTVDIILTADKRNTGKSSKKINYYSNIPVGDAIFSWEGNDLYLSSNEDIGGIQLAFNKGFKYVLSSELPRIEHLNYTQDASEIVMLYSFNNTSISNTKTKILTRLDATQDFNIDQAVVGTTFGAKLNATIDRGTLALDGIDAPFQSNQLEILNLYPNPSKGLVNLKYFLPEQMDQVIASVYDLQGRKVFMQHLNATAGNTESSLQLSKLSRGSYIIIMSASKDGGVRYLSHKTLILE